MDDVAVTSYFALAREAEARADAATRAAASTMPTDEWVQVDVPRMVAIASSDVRRLATAIRNLATLGRTLTAENERLRADAATGELERARAAAAALGIPNTSALQADELVAAAHREGLEARRS